MGFQTINGNWRGEGELWLDPLGNEVETSPVTASCDGTTFDYTWSHQGTEHRGTFKLSGDGVHWTDTFHQRDGADCTPVEAAGGLLTVQHEYSTPGYGTWGWRTGFYMRPDDSLVLQMTNIAPWGEEGRAVRMTLSRS